MAHLGRGFFVYSELIGGGHLRTGFQARYHIQKTGLKPEIEASNLKYFPGMILHILSLTSQLANSINTLSLNLSQKIKK